MVSGINQSIKPYRPPLPLRDRARQAFAEQQEQQAAERAAAFARAEEMAAASLVITCRETLGVIVDRSEILTAFVDQGRIVAASVIVESILLSISMRSAEAARLSGPIGLVTIAAEPHCPVCGATLSESRVIRQLEELGALLGEVGCGSCGWEPSA